MNFELWLRFFRIANNFGACSFHMIYILHFSHCIHIFEFSCFDQNSGVNTVHCTVGKMANLAPINSNFKIYNGAKTVLYSITNTSDRSLIFFILFCSQYSFSCKASKTTYVAPAVAKNFPSLFNNQLQFLIKFVGVTVKFFLVFLIKAKGMY